VIRDRCQNCSKPLENQPCILVESRRYCFRCSKSIVEELRVSREAQCERDHQRELAVYESTRQKLRAAHDEWSKRKDAAVGLSPGWLGLICLFWAATGAVVGYLFFGFIGGFFGFFVGGLLEQSWWSSEEARRLAAFIAKDPEPPRFNLPRPVSKHATIFFDLDRHSFAKKSDMSRVRVLQRDNYTCQSCGRKVPPEELEVHHVMPSSKGGPSHECNLITLCLFCHDREDWFGHVRAYPSTFRRRKRRN
jgi:DNA-directed RNA polymerase subunit RPC12/RpoP